MTTRLQELYAKTVKPALIQEFSYKNAMQVPKLQKIVINMGVGEAASDQKKMDAAVGRAGGDRRAEAAGDPGAQGRSRTSSCARACRSAPRSRCVGARMYEFLDRLVTIALPRVRDFRGLSGKSFDGRGNYALGLKEQIVFPEIDYDKIDAIRGMDIIIVTSARTNDEAKALLKGFDMPFVN